MELGQLTRFRGFNCVYVCDVATCQRLLTNDEIADSKINQNVHSQDDRVTMLMIIHCYTLSDENRVSRVRLIEKPIDVLFVPARGLRIDPCR